jgi:hypothetical protein
MTASFCPDANTKIKGQINILLQEGYRSRESAMHTTGLLGHPIRIKLELVSATTFRENPESDLIPFRIG